MEFLVTDSSGAVVGPNNGIYTTGEDGRAVITDLTPALPSLPGRPGRRTDSVLDGSPQSIQIKEGKFKR